MNVHVANETSGVVPFSLKDVPSLIERVFPSTKISAEAQKERKANHGQTLTALGSYWKGRKPLVLVKACVLGSLLPATEDPEADLAIFEALMAIDDDAVMRRAKSSADVERILSLPHDERVSVILRPEEVQNDLFSGVWTRVNNHLGTKAHSFPTLVEQLGIMRFGSKAVVADTFSGGGSIPFEAARLGCDVLASDLNPIACMLTWGALNVVGSASSERSGAERASRDLYNRIDRRISDLGIEHDTKGNRAKAYIYCLEARCPETGWMVPMAPSWVISKGRGVIAKLTPDHQNKRFSIDIFEGASAEDMKAADCGTIQDGRLVYSIDGRELSISIKSLRGDRRDASGDTVNDLRKWERSEFRPRTEDLFQERLYCIQWMRPVAGARQSTFFASVTEEDLQREKAVNDAVEGKLQEWSVRGLIADMPIEPGEKTSEPIRTRGWTHWHHLFPARHLLLNAIYLEEAKGPYAEYFAIILCRILNVESKLSRWSPAVGHDLALDVFYNQALNTMYNYGCRASVSALRDLVGDTAMGKVPVAGNSVISNAPATSISANPHIIITDPPYADAVNYHEINEYFIAWMRKDPPKEFSSWTWDSRRRLAIKGKGEEFRAEMVRAYKAMADRMPDNGIQVVMFTHQDGKVWSDMTQIFWGAGLQVMADWYIATETTSELKKGGYVQGTHCIVLRKRPEALSGYSDEISQEVKEAVAVQIEEMVGLNQTLRGHGRSENVFNDADLQMAGYAAALRVLTSYAKIDGKDMTVEAMRPRAKNERTLVDDIIEYAVQVANEHLVPEGMDGQTWRRLAGTERFYLKMLDIEQTGARKVDNYQNFAKAFRVADHGVLMASEKANDARLKSATDFGKRHMGADEFGSSLVRAVLYAVWEMGASTDDELVMEHLRGNVPTYLERRQDLQTVARYIAAKRRDIAPVEAANASLLADLIRNERLG